MAVTGTDIFLIERAGVLYKVTAVEVASFTGGGGGSSDPLDLTATGVSAPAADTIRLFRKDVAGRQMPAFKGPTGLDAVVQPFLATNRVYLWNASGNSNTAPILFGIPVAFTALGTATTRNVATTNFMTRLRRLGYVSAATAAAFCGHYSTQMQFTIGNTAGLGGFTYVCRFMPSDAALVVGARMFVGLRASVGVPTNVEPSTLTNVIGVAKLSGSDNLHIVRGGSVAQAPIDLGVDFPAADLSTAAYELALFASPNNRDVSYRVTRLDTSASASGTLTAANNGTQLPAMAQVLAHAAYRTNNATLLACGLDVVQVYIETDN